MFELYNFEGTEYKVSPDQLDKFLSDKKGAYKVGKITGSSTNQSVESKNMDFGSGNGSSVLLDRLEAGDFGEEPKDEVEQLNQIKGYYDQEKITPDVNVGYFPGNMRSDLLTEEGVPQRIREGDLMQPTDQITNQVAEFYTIQENQFQKDKSRLLQIDNPEAKANQEQNNPEGLSQAALDAKLLKDLVWFKEPDFTGGNSPKVTKDMYGVMREDGWWNKSQALLDAREESMLAETKKAKGFVFGRNGNDPLRVDEEISNYSPSLLSEDDQDIQALIKAGDQPGADALAEEKRYTKLYNKDGSFKDYMPIDQYKSAVDQATGTNLDDLKAKQRELYSRVIAAQKLAYRNTTGGFGDNKYGVGVTDHITGIMGGDLKSGYLFSEAASATATNSKANQLIETVKAIPGSAPIAEEHNRSLNELKTITQAIELNMNPELLPQVGSVIGFQEVIENRLGNVVSNDERADIFRGITEEIGLKPKSEFKREGDYYGRSVVEGSRDFVDDFGELALSLYVTKRLPVGVLNKGKDIMTLEAGMVASVNRISKAIKATTNSRTVARLTDVSLGAVKEIVTLGAADVVGDHLMGTEGFVYNKETKEVHLAFPASLGAGNVISSRILKKILSTESRFTRTLGRLNKGVENGTLSAIGNATAGAVAGTAVLTFGELVTEGLSGEQQYEEMEDGSFETIDQWKEIMGGRKMLETFIGMYMLGGKGTATNMYKGMKADIARVVQKSTVRGNAAAKRMNISVDATRDSIKDATNTQIRDVNLDTKLNEAQKLEKIKQIKADSESLYWHHEAMTAQKLAKKSDAQGVEREGTFALANKIKQGKELSPSEIQKFHDLKDFEFDLMKAKMGAAKNSKFGQMLDNQRDVYKSVIKAVSESRVWEAGGSEERNASIKLWMNVSETKGRIRALEAQGKGSIVMEGVNKEKVLKLKEKEKGLVEKLEQKGIEYDARLKEMMKSEAEFAKLMAAELGSDFKMQTEAEYEAAGGKKGSEGRFVREKGKRDIIYINETAALEARQLGTPLHEVTHAILKNSLKETYKYKTTKDGKIVKEGSKEYKAIKGEGKEKQVVSEQGMVIINQFLSKLNSKERAAVELRMEENYKYEKETYTDIVSGKTKSRFILNENGKKIKIPENEYYEEHITAFSDVLKNKEVKQTSDLARRIGDVLVPLLRKAGFKNLRAVGTNSGEGIFNMVKSLQVSSEKRTIDRDVLNAIKKTKKTTVDNIAESRTVTEAMEKASTELDKIYAEEGMGGYNKIIERLKGKDAEGRKVGKDFIQQYTEIYRDHAKYSEMKSELYDAMANDPTYGVLGSIIKYDPAKNPSIGSHILGRLKQGKHIDVANSILGKDAARQFTQSLDVAEAKEVESNLLSAEELFDAKEAEAQRAQAPNLRKSLNKGEEKGINQGLIDKVESTVLKTFGTKLPLPETKGFKKKLQDNYKTELKKPIADLMGKGPEYEVFLRENFEPIMKFVDKSFFVQMERLVIKNERIFTEVEIESMSAKQTDKAIAEGRVPKNTSRTAGNTLYRFKKPAPAQFLKFFTDSKLGSTKGTRKDRLAETLGIEMAKDMTSQVLSKPEVIAKIKDISMLELENSMQGIGRDSKKVTEAREMIFDNYMERVANEIGRDPNQMFSKTQIKKDAKELKALLKSMDVDNVFALRAPDLGVTALVKRKDGTSFHQEAVDGAYSHWQLGNLKDNIIKQFGKDGNIGYNYEPYLQMQGRGRIRRLNDSGIKIEGGVGEKAVYYAPEGAWKGGTVQQADMVASWWGNKQIWELKFNEAQGSRNPAGFVNYTKGTIARDKKRVDPKEEAMVVAALQKAIQNGGKIVEAVLRDQGVLKKGEDFTSQTKIPLDSHNSVEMKVKSKISDKSTTVNGKFIEGDYIKKAVYNFQIGGTGGFVLGEPSPNNRIAMEAGATRLEGNFVLKARVYATSYKATSGPKVENSKGEMVYPTAGYTYKLSATALISPKSITSKTTLNLDSPGAWAKMANTPYAKSLKQAYVSQQKALKSNKSNDKTGLLSESRTNREYIKNAKIVDKAFELGRKKNKKSRGMSTFDFDETVGFSNNSVIATKGGKTKRIASDKWPFVGDKLIKEGWKMDFTDFNKVTDGKPGPLMQKMKNQIKKFGPENVFILTARAKESQGAIHEYLKSEGIEIPLKNITGLGNSTGEAKAMWMLEKFSEGYNDMYFVDDALPNVKAVRNVLSQLDIKSKVQEVYSKTELNKDINNIIQSTFGVESKKKFSTAEGKVRGKDKKRRKFFMTDSASDLELLMEPMYGKGKKGVENKKWFEENFYKPWERGINDLNTARQTILNDYMGLRKQNKDIVKSLDKPVEGTNFSVDQAARVYIWNKAGFEVPGLTKTSKAKLLEHVANNPKLQAYAESVARLTKIETGLKQPKETWWAETIATEVQETGSTTGRKKYIGEWIERKNEIFTKENMAKMESELGPLWREATENMFDRMETGKTRNRDLGRIGNNVMNYLNGSVGAIMNFNTRSATLQLMSSVNFINHAENNVYAAGKAFANQPQYWKDFMTIMNSDMLKQRRDGLKINVTEAELAAAVHGPGSKAKKALSWILKQGYIPTKIADSFAISSGGATYYRNRAKMYQKQGLSLKEAEAKAFIDFAGIAEKTQQSSRADLLSQQQTSFEGRLLLPFANTPMQMNRIMVKGMLDIGKGRFEGNFGENSLTSKMSQVAYYGVVQSAIFAGLQSGLFALMANSDDDEKIVKTKLRAYNTMADSFLRGMGIPGVVASGVKNAGMKFYEQTQKGYGADYSEVGEALLNMSPTIGSKFSQLDAAGGEFMFNKKEILEKGFSLDNTHGIAAAAQTIEALTNVPINRALRKNENIQGALDKRNESWQRGMMLLGWGGWGLGVKDHDEVEVKGPVKTYKRPTYKRRTYTR